MENASTKIILNAIKKAINSEKANLHEPSFRGNEYNYIADCLKSTFVSSVGEYVDMFSNRLQKFTKAKYAVPVINGTAGIHASLIIAGVKQNYEVLVPSLTFIATANAVCYCNAIPHFVDVEENTLGIDPNNLRDYLNKISHNKSGKLFNKITGRRIKAIIPMHTFGHPCKIDEIAKIAKEFQLVVIEDAAEALGSFYKKKHVGNFGLAGVLSFNGNKTITTGAGGVVITNNKTFAKKLLHLTTTSKIQHQWDYIHDGIGYNYRMANLNAALGCAQLERLEEILKNKRELFEKYNNEFREIKNLRIFKEPDDCKSNYWLQTIILKKPSLKFRNQILKCSNDLGIKTRPCWKLLHKLKPFKNMPSASLKVSEDLEKKIINIPSSDFLIN